MNKKIHVKTGDTVVLLSGKDRGNSGKVLQVSPKEGKVIVEGRNMVTKHVKPRRQGEQGPPNVFPGAAGALGRGLVHG